MKQLGHEPVSFVFLCIVSGHYDSNDLVLRKTQKKKMAEQNSQKYLLFTKVLDRYFNIIYIIYIIFSIIYKLTVFGSSELEALKKTMVLKYRYWVIVLVYNLFFFNFLTANKINLAKNLFPKYGGRVKTF